VTKQIEPQEPRPGLLLITSIFLPLSAGYFLSFLYRSINAMIAPQLVDDLNLSAVDLGLLTAIYFLGFGLFQFPLGILLDRFGPAKVQSTLLTVAGLGALLFSFGDTFWLLGLGRGLIGVGVAGALMAAFTAFALWLPPRHLPLANGCLMGFGGLGAFAATKPVEWALGLTDWRGLFFVLSLVTVTVAVLVAIFVPSKPVNEKTSGLGDQLRGLAAIYRNGLFWRIAPLTIAGLGAGLSVQSLWAGTWLRDIANLSPSDVATHLSLIAVGLTVGPALSGVAASMVLRAGHSILSLLGVITCLFMAIQVLIILETVSISYLLWFAYGLLINTLALPYAILTQAFSRQLAGRVNTGLNMLMIGGVFVCQYLVGWVIERWPETTNGGYAPEAYQVGFSILLIMQAVAFIWFLAARKYKPPNGE
jgi:MFS family permease